MPTAVPTNDLLHAPLKYSGSLDHLAFFEISPIIGREYTTAKIRDILYADNAEQQIRDLAIIISERGVCFFRAPQNDLSVPEQKLFTDMLGKYSGRPKDHGLHVHPLHRDPNTIPMENGEKDENIYVINAKAQAAMYKSAAKSAAAQEPKDLAREWHSDLMFETCPADFSFLLMEETPPHGGDTLWCSGYEIYERISPSFRTYLESLTSTCAQPLLKAAAVRDNYEIMSPRGSPLNVGDEFAPSHPIVRTNRITGWKSIYAGMGLHVSRVNDVYSYEDTLIRDYITRLVTRNHDCIARMHWTKYAAAIWNNSCTFHAATPDTHLVSGSNRTGRRASSVGEVPYLDPNSVSRREALGIPT